MTALIILIIVFIFSIVVILASEEVEFTAFLTAMLCIFFLFATSMFLGYEIGEQEALHHPNNYRKEITYSKDGNKITPIDTTFVPK
jgi:hypothetical protein